MKKLSILFLAFIGLLFIGMYNAPTAQANLSESTALNVTVVEGKGSVNRTNQKLNLPHGFGSKVSVDVRGLVNSQKDFAYYILNGEKVDTQSIEITMSGSTHLVIVMAGAGEKAVSYVDTNGELLDVDYVTEGEPAFTGTNPAKPGYQFDSFVGSYDGDHAVYTAQYSRVDQTLITVDVTGGTKDLAEVKYNDVVTLSPTDAANFKYWADMEGQVISTNPNYAFTALKNVEIQAVTVGEKHTNPVIYLSNVSGITPNAKSFLGYVEGNFVEYGLLASNAEEVLTLTSAGVEVIPSQSLHPDTNEFLRTIPNTAAFKSFRAYGKLADGSVTYSENNYVVATKDLTFGFEDASKAGYATSVIESGGLDWNLNDSLIGTEGNDRKNGSKSVRVRNKGFIELQTPVKGVTNVSFLHGKYGTDSNGTLKVEIKINSGVWITINESVDVNTTTLTQFNVNLSEYNISSTDDVYIKISKVTGDRINIDDIVLSSSLNTKHYEMVLVNEETVTKSSLVVDTLFTEPVNPAKSGYTFVGWFDESGELFNFNTPIKRHTTLTAVYEINEYTLTFDSNGGTPVAPITGDYATDVVSPTAPTKEGYTFAGWSPVLPETMPAGNQTYTATWTANDYTITFDVDGGSNIESLTQAYGSELVLPVPTKDGFNFVGWFTDVDKTIPFEATTMPLGNTTLYALWQDASLTSRVTFEVNGGSEIEPVVVNNGEAVLKPADPTKEGHTFKGWYSDVALEVAYDFEALISTDLTLYAKWELNVYSISFNPNGGSGYTQVKSAVHGNALVAAERPTQPTKDGFNFVGWFDTNATSGGNEWTNETVFTSVKTYYARWESLITKETFTENFDGATVLPTGSNYGDATFTGINNITWSVVHGQQVGTYSITGAGILLRRASDSLLSTNLSGGLSSLSIDFRKGYSGGTTRNVEIIINGTVYDFLVNSSSGADVTVFKFSKDNLNLEGNVSISIKLKGTSTSNAHVVIDNFQWQNNPQ